MTKEQIAGILEQIATLLELKGQNSFDPADLPIFQTMVSTYRRGAAIGRVSLGRPDHGQILFQLEEQEAKGKTRRQHLCAPSERPRRIYLAYQRFFRVNNLA